MHPRERVPEPETFIKTPRGRETFGCLATMLAIPGVASTTVVWANFGPSVALIPLGVWLAIPAGAYVLSNVEHCVTLSRNGLRYSRARVIFGTRARDQVQWEVPLARLTKAREVKTRTPSSQGGWLYRTTLQLPDGHALDAVHLGGDSADSAYGRLVIALKERLGDAFEQTADYIQIASDVQKAPGRGQGRN